MTDAPSLKTYSGRCQCGAVVYEVDTDLQALFECNCSRCGRLGSILNFVPKTQFRLLRGADAQTEFKFHERAVHHLFCSTCGIQSYADGDGPGGAEMVAINVRCLDGVNSWALEPQRVDGARF